MRSVLLAPAIAIAVSGIRPVYSVSHVPGLYQRAPHPLKALLLQIKDKVQFDRAVTERSKLFFRVFRRSNQVQFRPYFFDFTVRSAEGRNGLEALFLADC
jgi:hypothetical protein